MNCLEFKTVLQSAIETRQLPDEEGLVIHRRQCAACQHDWNEYLLLAQAVASWKESIPEVDLTDSIVSRWLLETTGPVQFASPASSSEELAIASTQHVVLAPDSRVFQRRSVDRIRARQVFWIPGGLLLLFFLLIWREPSSTERSRLLTTASNKTNGSTVEPPLPELDSLLKDVESGYWVLANSAASTVSGAADLLPMRSVGMNGRPLFWSALMPMSSGIESTHPVEDDNKPSGPFRQGFSKAVDLLLEVVPAADLPTS
ncbi:MAG: hypothetical protein O2955_05225 [Planctomycetota bacterium]|nr:hypothetical protein [Planctomycetota bacterium]MDA1211895.1 hypothetical protein [Planctomycetota bacterium]